MEELTTGISRRHFLVYLSLIVASVVAFPLYQVAQTGGPIFYTTNVDEASHLSYWYASYVVEDSGRQRASSRLIQFLHGLGISGGYINLLLDVACTITIIVCFCRIYHNLGCSRGQARLASLVTFLLTTVFSRFNPLLAWLNDVRLETDLVRWLSMPQNSENMFLRSPEPQLSFTILLVTMAFASTARMGAIAGIVISSLLYPFVRMPVLFMSAAYLPWQSWGYRARVLISFAGIALATLLFLRFFVEPSLLQFFIFSHLPVLPLTGVIAVCVFWAIRKHAPPHLVRLGGLLVASIWAVENTQIVSGWLVTPVNYEQYWGVLVLSGLTAVAILYRSKNPALWLHIALVCFLVHAVHIFRDNAIVFNELGNRREVLQALRTNSQSVACHNLRLATYLNLAYPMQPPTALSWTRTLNAKNNDNYLEYSCVKRAIEKLAPPQFSQFNEVFNALEIGYIVKGSDLNVTMGRQEIVQFPLPTPGPDSRCSLGPLMLCQAP